MTIKCPQLGIAGIARRSTSSLHANLPADGGCHRLMAWNK